MSAAEDALGAPAGGTVDPDNPWPGLLPFREADQAWFQGRRAETAELLRRVLRERLTVLFGLSGLGKSSLLQAGLFPALRQENVLPVYIRLDFSQPEPDLVAQVKTAILQQAAAAGVEAPAGADGTLWEYFHRRNADFWNPRNRPVVPLLAFDQFEELFTLGRRDVGRAKATERFLAELGHLVEGSLPETVEDRLNDHPDEAEEFTFGVHRYKVLLAIREDFLPDLEGLRSTMSSIALNRFRLCRMDGNAALLAVSQASHLVDPPVAEQVVRFVAAAKRRGTPLKDLEVEPALLSVVCRELNNKRRHLGQPKITTFLLEGSQEQVLAAFYERSAGDLPHEVRTFIEERLLTVSGYRDSVALENALTMPGITREAINRLVERRLVRIEDRGGQRLELTHDLLTGVIRASRDRRRMAEAGERERLAREEAEDRERIALRQLRHSRAMAAGFLLLALVAVAAAVLAYFAQQRAVQAQVEERRAREQAGSARQEAERQRAQADQTAREREIAARQAEEATAAAKLSAAAAQQAQANALDQANRAEAAAKDEAAARKSAQEAADIAAENARKADEQTEVARKQTEVALAAERREKDQREEVGRALARSDVLDAARQAELQHNQQAFSYLARALRADPTSMAAASWIFDLLLRGSGPLPSGALRVNGQDYPVTHAALQPKARVLSAAFSPDAERVVTSLWNNMAEIWNWKGGARTGSPLAQKGLVNMAVFDRTGRYVLTASHDGTAQVWDAQTGAKAGMPMTHKLPVNAAAFSSDGQRVVTASQDNTAVVWNWQTGQQIWVLRHDRPVTSAAFSPDGRLVVTGSWNGAAEIWNVTERIRPGSVMRHAGQVNSVAFSPDGRRIVTASSDGTAQVWENGNPVGEQMRHRRGVNSAAFSPDGRRVVTASDDNTARLWEANTGSPIGAPLRHTERVTSAAFSPDGRRVITSSYDQTAQVWEVWFDFDDPALLAELAELVGGYDLNALPNFMQLQSDSARRNALRERVRQLHGATAEFVRWILTRPDPV